jgi:hypothetical protein
MISGAVGSVLAYLTSRVQTRGSLAEAERKLRLDLIADNDRLRGMLAELRAAMDVEQTANLQLIRALETAGLDPVVVVTPPRADTDD